MTKISLVLILSLSVSSVLAQKVKYKDIFELISAKQYDLAEPFLKTYLKDNTDNPNAYLYMGEIYKVKAEAQDILLNTDRSIQQMDSAILYFDNSLKGLTEKTIKKDKEYYVAYNQRDLRTGEFGVTLSNVKYDLEKKIQGLRERIDKVRMTKFYFTESERLYKRANGLFVKTQAAYPGQRELYLRADEPVVANLSNLSMIYDSSAKFFEYYKGSLENFKQTKYRQQWSVREIADFKVDGKELTDFYGDELKVWDYKKFATKTLDVIEKEVKPTQDNLVKYDIEINKLRMKLETDSVSVISDLTKLVDSMLDTQLKKFDPDPLPMDIFGLKIADLEYKSRLIENMETEDSDDVYKKLDAVKAEVKILGRLDSLGSKTASRNLDEDIINYQQFVKNTFSKGDILKSYVRSLKDYAGRERAIKEKELAFRTEALKWLIVNNDSIPLVDDQVKSRFWPLVVLQDKYTAGLTFKDSISNEGYFYSITPSRKPDVKVTFPVDKTSMKERRQNGVKAYVTSDPAGQVFFVLIYLDRMVNGKHPATIAKIYKTDGLSWSHTFGFDLKPHEIVYAQDTGELLIKSDGDSFITIDKNGKLLLK
jgi:hypothetical protein